MNLVIKILGSHVIHITMRSKNPLKYYKELNEFMKQHATDYQAVWVNVCSLANIDYLKVAKKYGVQKRIIHSHNSQNMDNWMRKVLHMINRYKIQKYATDFWACSEDAARWFYKKNLQSKAVIIENVRSDPGKRAFARHGRGYFPGHERPRRRREPADEHSWRFRRRQRAARARSGRLRL